MLIQTGVSCAVSADRQKEIGETSPELLVISSLRLDEDIGLRNKQHFEYFQCFDEKTRVRLVATAVERQ